MCNFIKKIKEKEGIGEIFFKIYFVFVNILFFLYLFDILYEDVLCEYIYLRYLPDPVVYPAYDIKTGLIANANEVTFWSVWDHVPWYGVISDRIAGYTSIFSFLLYLFALIFLIPIAVFNFTKKLWKYWLIILLEIIISWFLIYKIIIYY